MSNDKPTTQAPWPRHRWISLSVIITGLLMAALAGMKLGGDLPELVQLRTPDDGTSETPFPALMNRPNPTDIVKGPKMMGADNPFYTDFFQPPPKPAPPPKPTMKTVKVVYQGWFESSSGEIEAFVSIDGKATKGAVNEALGADLQLLEIHSDYIRIKSKDDQEHKVRFSQTASLKIPIP